MIPALNAYSGVEMDCKDATHPIPESWLKANARRFHFTDAEIVGAAQPKPITDDPMRDIDPRRVCGIYFLLQNTRIVYVGQSVNIFRRIAQHMQFGVNFDFFTWFEAPRLHLNAIEGYYIERIKPPMNTERPGFKTFQDFCKEFDVQIHTITNQ